MRSVLRVLVLAAVVCHGLSGEAYAQRGGGIWEWIDKLSGPGPFTGWAGWFGYCLDKQDGLLCSNESEHWVNFRLSRTTNDESPDREILFPDVTLWTIEPSFDTRVHDFVDDTVYLELGAAAGFLHFGGADFDDFWEFSATPVRVGFVTWPRSWLTAEVRVSVSYLFAELDASDFGAQGDFAINGEWNPSWYVGVSWVP